MYSPKETIQQGRAILGIEFGSTRIKAVLIDETHTPIAAGSHRWENHFENGFWTYPLDEILEGLQECYRALQRDVTQRYGVPIRTLAAIGCSAMMHGYLAFDRDGCLLTPFRTWRNDNTAQAARILTDCFGFPIPERWSVAHLYQAILDREPHVPEISFLTTLAGMIHWKLTGEKVLGIGDASGMFPVNGETGTYDAEMLSRFQALDGVQTYPWTQKCPWTLSALLPRVLRAGDRAGSLTPEGARLLDPSGALQPGIVCCPPEGDAGTGMAATNSILARTGNVSAGTSIFGMVVLERPLQKVHREIDLVTTPDGAPVAMVHANNCSSDINAWVSVLGEFTARLGAPADTDTLYRAFFEAASEGDPDCGGLLSYGYLSGENITGISHGRPLLVRTPDSRFTFTNLARVLLSAAFGALKTGMDILSQEEHVTIDTIYGHGGLFTTRHAAQQVLADAIQAPVAVMQTAGEGGPWGMALLAAYMVHRQPGESLGAYLAQHVFADAAGEVLSPDPDGASGFSRFAQCYQRGLPIEKAAGEFFS